MQGPDQTASEEAVWSGSSLFAILADILWFKAQITNILWEQKEKSVWNFVTKVKTNMAKQSDQGLPGLLYWQAFWEFQSR